MTLLPQRFLAQALITLPQLTADLSGHSDQGSSRFVIPPGIGWESDGFLLHRGIDVDPFDFRLLECLLTTGGVERLFEQAFNAFGSETFAPLDQRRRIARQLV